MGIAKINMRLQKQLSKRTKDKDYHRFVIAVPNDIIEQSGLKEGDSLEAVDIKKGEMRIRKKY